VIAETTAEIDNDSEEEYNKSNKITNTTKLTVLLVLQNVSMHASAKKTKFKRRSQLPVRPETDDEEDDFGESQLEDMDDDMGSFIDDNGSEIAESDVADDESMDADEYSEDERQVAKTKSKYGRIVSLDSESDDNDDTPNSLDSDVDEDFGRKPVRRKMIINSDSESD
jgi:hypothetical protein